MTASAVYADPERAAGMREWERCRRHPLYWAERYAFTRDEKDHARPFKPLIAGRRAIDDRTLGFCRALGSPEEPDEYLRWLTMIWWVEKLVAVPKSRQQRVSWWAVAMQLWLAEFWVAQRCAIQSKKAQDADKMLDRGVVILEQQDVRAPHIPWRPWRKTTGVIQIQHGGFTHRSRIEGIPAGREKIRSEAYSSIMSDEMAFQVDAAEAYAAAAPLIEGGCRYLAISSAEGGSFFEALCADALESN